MSLIWLLYNVHMTIIEFFECVIMLMISDSAKCVRLYN